MVELAKLEFGIEDNPNVIVSVPLLPEIVKPCPDELANVKLPLALSARSCAPPAEAVEKAFIL